MELCPRCGSYGTRYILRVKGIPYVYFAHREGDRVRKCYIGRAGERPRAVGRPRGVAHVRSEGVEAGGGAVEPLLEKIARSLSRREEKRVEVVDDELRKVIEDYVRVKNRVEERALSLLFFLLSLPLLMVFFPSGIPILIEKFERIISGSDMK